MLVNSYLLVHGYDRSRRRWSVPQSRMGSFRVLVRTPLFDDDLCLFEAVEDFSVE